MESFTIALISNASAQLFLDNTLSSFINLSPEQLNVEGQWEVAFRKHLTHQWTKTSQRENLCFLIEKFQGLLNFTIWNLVSTLLLQILLKPWTLSFKKDIITAKAVSQIRTRKLKTYLAFEGFGLAFLSTDQRHFFKSNVGNDFVMMRGKGPQKPEIACDNVRIHSHDIHGSDWVQYRCRHEKFIAALLFLISMLKAGDIITTGEYMNYQSFCNMQFRPLLKNSFQSIHIDLRDTSVEIYRFYLLVSLVLFWHVFWKASNFRF